MHFPVHVPIHLRHFNFIFLISSLAIFVVTILVHRLFFFKILFTKLWINVDQTRIFCTNTTTHHRPYTIKIRINVKSINLHIYNNMKFILFFNLTTWTAMVTGTTTSSQKCWKLDNLARIMCHSISMNHTIDRCFFLRGFNLFDFCFYLNCFSWHFANMKKNTHTSNFYPFIVIILFDVINSSYTRL